MTHNGKGLPFRWWRSEGFAITMGVLMIVACGALILLVGTARDAESHQPQPTQTGAGQ